MRLRITLFVGLIAAMALGISTIGTAASGDKVTGGGQTDVGTNGAGDTIAFTVQENSQGLIGQVQYVDREGGTGQGQVVYHGTPTCLVVEGKVANFAGVWRDGGEFEIVVEDNGSGAGQDLIGIAPQAADPECGDDENEETTGALARGNVTVHDQE